VACSISGSHLIVMDIGGVSQRRRDGIHRERHEYTCVRERTFQQAIFQCRGGILGGQVKQHIATECLHAPMRSTASARGPALRPTLWRRFIRPCRLAPPESPGSCFGVGKLPFSDLA